MIVCGVKAVLRLYVLHIHLPLLSVRHFIKFFFFLAGEKGDEICSDWPWNFCQRLGETHHGRPAQYPIS